MIKSERRICSLYTLPGAEPVSLLNELLYGADGFTAHQTEAELPDLL